MPKPKIPRALIELIRREGEVMDLSPATTIFEAGSEEEAMYLLDEGRVAIRFEGGWDEIELQPGEIFGELALIFEDHSRTGSAISVDRARVIRVDKAGFDRLADKAPRLMFDLLRNTSASLLRMEHKLVERLRASNRSLKQANDYLRRTQTELSERELEARTDALTGIYNRRCFDEHLDKHLPLKPEDPGLGVLYVDMDRFKSINDVPGHACGDVALKAVAKIIRQCVRKSDMPCRIGGDEFAVLMADTNRGDAMAIGQRIHESITDNSLPVPYQNVRLSVSVGGALAERDESVAGLLRRVDSALYDAKGKGRNQVVWDDSSDATVFPNL
ncbi:MAG: GGDEF domain-containing protein [Gammaproteobacteria bacterium]